jgi:hypothetical protein
MEKIVLTRNKAGYINIELNKDTLNLTTEELIALYCDAIHLLKSQILSIENE